MCAAAMVLARLSRLVYAAADPKKGADGSAYRLLDHPANKPHRSHSRFARGRGGRPAVRFFAAQRRLKKDEKVR